MTTITRYVLLDREDNEVQTFKHYPAALSSAVRHGFAIIEQTYEYADSSLVWTPDGGSTWPPEDGDPNVFHVVVDQQVCSQHDCPDVADVVVKTFGSWWPLCAVHDAGESHDVIEWAKNPDGPGYRLTVLEDQN